LLAVSKKAIKNKPLNTSRSLMGAIFNSRMATFPLNSARTWAATQLAIDIMKIEWITRSANIDGTFPDSGGRSDDGYINLSDGFALRPLPFVFSCCPLMAGSNRAIFTILIRRKFPQNGTAG
jgi:hypothetical protein